VRASTRPAETSRRIKTSGEAAGRAKNQRFRETSARKDEPVTSADTQGESARRRSQTLGVRAVQAEERGGIRGRPKVNEKLLVLYPFQKKQKIEENLKMLKNISYICLHNQKIFPIVGF
jgi:hypothetical protein